MKAIFKRELRAFFTTNVGYIYLASFQLLSSFFFLRITDLRMLDLTGSFFFLIFVLILLLPMLTMRSLSEEKKNKTDQLLLTSPTSAAEVIVGKFFANFVVFSISILLTMSSVIIMSIFGKPPFLQIFSQYFGLFLLGSSLIAIGIFCSSLTENQVVSAVISFSVFILLFFIDCVPISNTFFIKLLDSISLIKRYDEFNIGIFNFASIFHYLTITVTFLILASMRFEVNKYRKSRIKGVFIILLMIFFNSLFFLISAKFDVKMDLTKNKLYTLSEETREVIKKLDKKVTIYELGINGQSDSDIHNFVSKYGYDGNKIKNKFVNLSSDVEFANKYINDEQNVKNGSLIVECGEKYKFVHAKGFRQTFGDEVDMEQKITSAIDYVTKNNENFVIFTTGHNEAFEEFESIREVLDSENYTQLPMDLTREKILDENINAAVIVDPDVDFSSNEIDELREFCNKGNSVLIFLSASENDTPKLRAFLNEWGVDFKRDRVVVETNNAMWVEGLTNRGFIQLLMPEIKYHEVTKDIYKTHITMANPIVLEYKEKEGCYSQSLFDTSDDAFSVRIGKRGEKSGGLHHLGVAVSKHNSDSHAKDGVNNFEQKAEMNSDGEVGEDIGPPLGDASSLRETKIIAIASPSILNDDVANKKFLISALKFIANKEDSVIIQPKTISYETMVVSKETKQFIEWLLQIFIPLALVLTGHVVRKKRQKSV